MSTIHIDSGFCRYHIDGLPSDTCYELKLLYGNSYSEEVSEFPDYFLHFDNTSFFRRFIRPQKVLKIEGERPFNPISPSKALPSVEWAFNWCIAAFEHQKLIFQEGETTCPLFTAPSPLLLHDAL